MSAVWVSNLHLFPPHLSFCVSFSCFSPYLISGYWMVLSRLNPFPTHFSNFSFYLTAIPTLPSQLLGFYSLTPHNPHLSTLLTLTMLSALPAPIGKSCSWSLSPASAYLYRLQNTRWKKVKGESLLRFTVWGYHLSQQERQDRRSSMRWLVA